MKRAHFLFKMKSMKKVGTALKLLINTGYQITLRWTDTGSRIMAAILFLITYQNIQKWFKIYQICAFNNFPSHFDRISPRGGEIFENSN